MVKRFKTRVVFVLLLCSLLLVSMLFYFMIAFEDTKKITVNHNISSSPLIVFSFDEVRPKNESLQQIFLRKLQVKVQNLIKKNSVFSKIENDLQLRSLKDQMSVNQSLSKDYERVWTLARKWVRARTITPVNASELGSVLSALQTAPILASDVSRKGTQLKLLLTLAGGEKKKQFALFKPKRYPRDYITDDIYSGADRHNGEVFAFHLARILGLRFAPIVASRVVHVSTEIKKSASEALLSTFVNQTQGNQTQECFYGECYYCNEYDTVCADDNDRLEGAVILMLPMHYKLQKLRNPWQRTYKKNTKAKWENDSHYCLSVQKSTNQERLLDYVDLSIFDFLIGNADRHHYEVFKDVPNSALLMIDNGKSFGDPGHDEITILFPLLQCCMLRNSTYRQLQKAAQFKLSRIAKFLLSDDLLWPLLTEPHLEALDRRLVMVLGAVDICFDTFNKNDVLKF